MKILIVEDQAPTLHYLVQLCKKIFSDAQIISLSHFDNSISLLKSTIFDLIITDLDFDGAKKFAIVEMARDLKIPCIVYTAFYNPTVIKKSLDLSIAAFVCKLGSIEDLKLAIDNFATMKQNVCSFTQSKLSDNVILNIPEPILTPIEHKLLKMLVTGVDRKEIASKMKIKSSTLNSYIKDVKVKNSMSLAELIRSYVYWF